ncbi:MAG: Maf family nucleotide pyrophosphatase [Muribaculaceae bacterium]|nr:Maf family nucleotide pyrophosphatase [Muribaculaceae bacterium]
MADTAFEHPSILPPLPSEAFRDVNIVLASNSPRRRELLSMIAPGFIIAPPRSIEEKYPSDLTPTEVPAYLSRLKSDAYADILTPGELLITADTVVIADGKILGKPHDADDAVSMLKTLRDATHTVVTGVTLRSLDGRRDVTFSESTQVTFGHLSDAEIQRYVELYRPFDKAGAYGIQEWIGASAICGISGCFYNVMGLPLHALYGHLKEFYS